MEKEKLNHLYFVICIGFILTMLMMVGSVKDIENVVKNKVCICPKDTIVVYQSLIKEVTITVYHPVKEQCDSTPLITANGTQIDLEKLEQGQIKYCAVSQDLLDVIPYGSTIYIEGYGEYEVVDTMNKRMKNTVDILQDVNKPIFKKTGIIVKL